jgi:DNA-binding response OmpR family regulator
MSNPKRILVVDDNPVNCEIIEEILGDEYEVIVANNGVDALALAQRYQPRIILLDVMLPEVDGYLICRKLRSMSEVNKSRIIMVTAKAMPSERAQGFAAGADSYITKPFDETELIAAIRPMHKLSKAFW